MAETHQPQPASGGPRRAADEGLLLGQLDAVFAPAPEAGGHAPVVALVGSAGGVDAVGRVLAGLPADLPAAVLVLLHQSPTHVSRLVDVLRRRCALRVEEARHGARLVPGQVLVAPPGRHVLVTPVRRVGMIVSGAYPPSRPSADLLLTTLATAVGHHAIAVVLSGGGHDGATGASAVHAFGGTVLATDEASSEAWSMPLAAIMRDAAVDRVLDLDAIAPALVELVAGGVAPTRA